MLLPSLAFPHTPLLSLTMRGERRLERRLLARHLTVLDPQAANPACGRLETYVQWRARALQAFKHRVAL